jgi:hypothetical protein
MFIKQKNKKTSQLDKKTRKHHSSTKKRQSIEYKTIDKMYYKSSFIFIQSLLVMSIHHGIASELRLGKTLSDTTEQEMVHRGLADGILTLVGDNFGPGFPLNACEGDCNTDSDCKLGLKCFNRNNMEPVPGCTGDVKPLAGTDFCYVPPASPPPGTLNRVGNNGAAGLLNNCEGDCDNDGECYSGLKCFQRTDNRTVPGCTGDKKQWWGTDFCYIPAVTPGNPPLKYVGNNGGRGFPLNACEGDCDHDGECKSGLKCMQRRAYEIVPGCSGENTYRGYDFCYKP